MAADCGFTKYGAPPFYNQKDLPQRKKLKIYFTEIFCGVLLRADTKEGARPLSCSAASTEFRQRALALVYRVYKRKSLHGLMGAREME
jgi:hypothetical protein